MTSELKPCPFCGSRAVMKMAYETPRSKEGQTDDEEFIAFVDCSSCSEDLFFIRAFSNSPEKAQEEVAKAWNTRAVPDVPELVTVAYLRTTDQKAVSLRTADHHTDIVPLVLHSQAAEIIRSMIPRVNNCGRYIAERNDGTLMYLNHGNTWQGCDNFIAAKDKEIEMAEKHRNDMADKIVDQRTEIAALRAKLAQYEAQEPVAWFAKSLYSEKIIYNVYQVNKRFRPLYASPAPAADLKAENEEIRGQAMRIIKAFDPDNDLDNPEKFNAYHDLEAALKGESNV